MEPSTEARYAPPRKESEVPADPPRILEEVRAARIAGALIAFTSVVGLGLTLYHRWSDLGYHMVARFIRLGIDMFLAVPLLQGNRRFRWLTVIVVCIGIPAAIVRGFRPDLFVPGASPEDGKLDLRLIEDCFYVAAVVLLLTGKPGRTRRRLAVCCVALFLLFWGLREWSYYYG